jgi:hypothetical protein
VIGVFVCCGLGNQMFQYAAARALALRHRTEVVLDLSAFSAPHDFETERSFELNHLAIEVAPNRPFSSLGFLLARRPQAVLRRLSGWNTVREQELGRFETRFASLSDDIYLFGYWQSWRYFDSIQANIREEFTPRNSLSPKSRELAERVRSANSLSLHVRRGDYVSSTATNAFHGVLEVDFYTRAVRHVQRRNPHLEVFVFSDDIDWCKRELSHLGLPMTLVDVNRGANSWQDMFLMAECRHCVIANSSFSWWGAWLGDGQNRPDRMVVAPRRWFAGEDVEMADRCPPHWIVM